VARSLDRSLNGGTIMIRFYKLLTGAVLAVGLASPAAAQTPTAFKGEPSAANKLALLDQSTSATARGARADSVALLPPVEAVAAVSPPRYTIEAISFKALNETGLDIFGSDEIVARYSVGDRSTFTGVYGDVDTGETHQLRSGQQCVYPAVDPDGAYNHSWSCLPRGAPGPVAFQVTLYEYDGTLRQILTNSTQICLHGSNYLITRCDDVQLASTAVGSRQIAYTEAELATAMPTIGMSVMETIPIGTRYEVNFRLTRKRGTIVPPVGDEPPLSPAPPCVPSSGQPCP
jgi:hypothetical protein